MTPPTQAHFSYKTKSQGKTCSTVQGRPVRPEHTVSTSNMRLGLKGIPQTCLYTDFHTCRINYEFALHEAEKQRCFSILEEALQTLATDPRFARVVVLGSSQKLSQNEVWRCWTCSLGALVARGQCYRACKSASMLLGLRSACLVSILKRTANWLLSSGALDCHYSDCLAQQPIFSKAHRPQSELTIPETQPRAGQQENYQAVCSERPAGTCPEADFSAVCSWDAAARESNLLANPRNLQTAELRRVDRMGEGGSFYLHRAKEGHQVC